MYNIGGFMFTNIPKQTFHDFIMNPEINFLNI